MKKETTTILIECPDCQGEGQWYNDTSTQCTVYRNHCCGGCGYYVPCEKCNETGQIEIEKEDYDEKI